MGKINLIVNDKLEEKFRQLAFQKFGYRRGSLQRAVEEAITEWVQKISDLYDGGRTLGR